MSTTSQRIICESGNLALFRIRTITVFVSLSVSDFDSSNVFSLGSTVFDQQDPQQQQLPTEHPQTIHSTGVAAKIQACANLLQQVRTRLLEANYSVQTCRIATNPFPEWLLPLSASSTLSSTESRMAPVSELRRRLQCLDDALNEHDISFCSLGSATNVHHLELQYPSHVQAQAQNEDLEEDDHHNEKEIASSLNMTHVIPFLLSFSSRFSCSIDINDPMDILLSTHAAQTILQLAKLNTERVSDAINFRFCVQANCRYSYFPFFPVATCNDPYLHPHLSTNDSSGGKYIRFAIGLENGAFFQYVLQKFPMLPLDQLMHQLQKELVQLLAPIQRLCQEYVLEVNPINRSRIHPDHPTHSRSISKSPFHYEYLGIDTSLNPSLDEQPDGSVARVLELLLQRALQHPHPHPTKEVCRHYPVHDQSQPILFGQTGTLAVAAQLTRVLQSLNNNVDSHDSIRTTGYCGIMLPVCEDRYLASFASSPTHPTTSTVTTIDTTTTSHDDCVYEKNQGSQVNITQLLNISSVCGVGIDTVPIPGNVTMDKVTGLILDVIGLAHKWKKPLTCRVFPCPRKVEGDRTDFDSPYLCNCSVFSLS